MSLGVPRPPSFVCVTDDGLSLINRQGYCHGNTENKAGQASLIVFRQKTKVRQCRRYTWILDRHLIRRHMIV